MNASQNAPGECRGKVENKNDLQSQLYSKSLKSLVTLKEPTAQIEVSELQVEVDLVPQT